MNLHLISRDIAIAKNFTFYFTGTPCRRGHICERYTSNWKCVACAELWASTNRNKIVTPKNNNKPTFNIPITLAAGKLIYIITNTLTNKSYIGQTVDIRNRWYQHVCSSSKCNHLRNAIQKYGQGAFEITVLLHGLTQQEADDLEKQLIWWHGTIANGYNLAPGGRGTGSKEQNHMYGLCGTNNPNFGAKRSKRTKIITDGYRSGEKHPMSKLTDQQRDEIRDLYATGNYTQTSLGRMFKVTQETIHSIIKETKVKKTPPVGENNPNAKLTNEQRAEIRSLYATNLYTMKQLAVMFGVASSTIQYIITNREPSYENP